MISAIIQHGSPARRGRRNTQTKKTQRCFRKYGDGHSDAGLNQDWLNDVRQNMTNKNSRAGCPQSPRPLNKLESLNLQNLTSSQSCISDPADDDQSKNQTIETGAQESHKCNRQENSGEGQQRVNDHHRYKCIQPATDITGKPANRNANYDRQQNNRRPYPHADAGT